jgi:hypothetical protein
MRIRNRVEEMKLRLKFIFWEVFFCKTLAKIDMGVSAIDYLAKREFAELAQVTEFTYRKLNSEALF